MRALRGHLRTRALGALLIPLVLLAGALDLHVLGDEDHGHHGLDRHGPVEDHLHVVESHPDLPLHVEGSVVLEHPHCPTCMLRLYTPSTELDPYAGVPTLVAAHALRWPEPPAAEAQAARWISARAPPHLV